MTAGDDAVVANNLTVNFLVDIGYDCVLITPCVEVERGVNHVPTYLFWVIEGRVEAVIETKNLVGCTAAVEVARDELAFVGNKVANVSVALFEAVAERVGVHCLLSQRLVFGEADVVYVTEVEDFTSRVETHLPNDKPSSVV